MEIRINFVECFETDIVLSILSKLEDPADLIRIAAVSRSWRHFVINNCLSKNLCLRKAPMIANINAIIEQEEGMLTMDCRTGYPLSFEILMKDHRMYLYILEALSQSLVAPKDCMDGVIGASSTHRYPAESIVNILVGMEESPWGASYWSSKGERDPNVPESILLKLKGGVCIVTEVEIRPFECYFEPGNPIYSANSVRFRMGRPRSSRDLRVDVESLPLRQLDDNNYVWEYTSSEYSMIQQSSLQSFKLPEPVLCIGGYLQIELLGRSQRKEQDGLYYFCMSHVTVQGLSLKPAFDIEMGTSGSISLKYCPEAVEGVLRQISEPEEESDEENRLSEPDIDDALFEHPPPNYALSVHQIENLWQLVLFR